MTLPATIAEHPIKISIGGGLLLILVFAWKCPVHPNPQTSGSSQMEHEIVCGQAAVRARRRAWTDLDPTLHLGALTFAETKSYEGSGRNLFEPILLPAPVPGSIHHELTLWKPAQIVAPFSTGLRLYGFSSNANDRRVFLLKGEDLFLAQEGDTFDRRYRILRVTRDSVEVEDVLAGQREWLYLPHS